MIFLWVVINIWVLKPSKVLWSRTIDQIPILSAHLGTPLEPKTLHCRPTKTDSPCCQIPGEASSVICFLWVLMLSWSLTPHANLEVGHGLLAIINAFHSLGDQGWPSLRRKSFGHRPDDSYRKEYFLFWSDKTKHTLFTDCNTKYNGILRKQRAYSIENYWSSLTTPSNELGMFRLAVQGSRLAKSRVNCPITFGKEDWQRWGEVTTGTGSCCKSSILFLITPQWVN